MIDQHLDSPEYQQHPMSTQESLALQAEERIIQSQRDGIAKDLSDLNPFNRDIEPYKHLPLSAFSTELLIRRYGGHDELSEFYEGNYLVPPVGSNEITPPDADNEASVIFQQRLEALSPEGGIVEGLSLDKPDDVVDLLAIISATSRLKPPEMFEKGKLQPPYLRAAKLSESLYGSLYSSLYGLPVVYNEDDNFDRVAASRDGSIFISDDGNIQRIVLPAPAAREGINLVIEPEDPTKDSSAENQTLAIRLEYQEDIMLMARDDNNIIRPEAPRFIESQTAKELLGTFDSLGLRPSKRIINSFTEQVGSDGFSSRYGNGYADFSREIAKVVNNPARSLSKLFEVDTDGEEGGDDQVRAKLLGLKDILPETPTPAGIQLAILLQLAERTTEDLQPESNDLACGENKIEMRTGSCKDFELSLASQGSLPIVELPSVNMIQRNFKPKTYLATGSVRFNGILLPPGSLFVRDKENEDQYYYMRTTAFALSDDDRVDAFGAEYRTAEIVSGESAIRAVDDIIDPNRSSSAVTKPVVPSWEGFKNGTTGWPHHLSQ